MNALVYGRPMYCLNDEELAAYIDGTLSNFCMVQITEHLNYCPRCYELVSEARAVLQMGQRDAAIAQDEVREEYRESYRQIADRTTLLNWKIERAHDD